MKRRAALGWTLWPLAAWAETPAPAVPAVNLGQWLSALVLVLGLIFLGAWLLRRLGSFSRLAPGRFRVLAAVSLGARERAVLLQAGGKQLVLGVAPGRVETLCVLEGTDSIPVEEAPPPPEAAGLFAQRLAELLNRKRP
ncbi:flagellar biosynthetic protein FliO [Methylomagnum ishizawai]|uniref:flagellar biosynthetic protein FliO n=1 Tax=Methylomagnum ishizawai TaxID=1760988 RepID=UPI001C32EE07|nr:flagellar biosynthetic protein FliO [Methylomagnum ishizawai]BBL77012.1 flagellar protein [Methylomagnum ishizawai]